MHRMVPLAELAGHPDDGRDALMRGLVIAGAARNLQVRVAVEPDLLQLTHEMQYVLARVQVSAHVEGAEFQDALLAQLGLHCNRRQRLVSVLPLTHDRRHRIAHVSYVDISSTTERFSQPRDINSFISDWNIKRIRRDGV